MIISTIIYATIHERVCEFIVSMTSQCGDWKLLAAFIAKWPWWVLAICHALSAYYFLLIWGCLLFALVQAQINGKFSQPSWFNLPLHSLIGAWLDNQEWSLKAALESRNRWLNFNLHCWLTSICNQIRWTLYSYQYDFECFSFLWCFISCVWQHA